MFVDHAVLQRDRPINVYGRARAGEEVTVTLAGASAQRAGRCEGRLVADAAGDGRRRAAHAHRARRLDNADRERRARRRRVAVLRAVEHGMAGAQYARCRLGSGALGQRSHPAGHHRARQQRRAAHGFRRAARVAGGRAHHHRAFLGRVLLLRARAAEDRERAAGHHLVQLGRLAHRAVDERGGVVAARAVTSSRSSC